MYLFKNTFMDPRVKTILENLLAGENILYDDFEVLSKYLEDAVIGYDPKMQFIPVASVRKMIEAAYGEGSDDGDTPSDGTIERIIKSNIS
jgi:hypothetical protein